MTYQEALLQPIIFDHVNHIVVQVGVSPGGTQKYLELMAAQQRPKTP